MTCIPGICKRWRRHSGSDCTVIRVTSQGGTHLSHFFFICRLLDKILSSFGLNRETAKGYRGGGGCNQRSITE